MGIWDLGIGDLGDRGFLGGSWTKTVDVGMGILGIGDLGDKGSGDKGSWG